MFKIIEANGSEKSEAQYLNNAVSTDTTSSTTLQVGVTWATKKCMVIATHGH